MGHCILFVRIYYYITNILLQTYYLSECTVFLTLYTIDMTFILYANKT